MLTYNLFLWLPYYILGVVGIFFHILSKLKKGDSLRLYIRENVLDVSMSVLAYHVLLFFWYDSGIDFLGMVRSTPNGLTFMLGWFGNSVLGHLVSQFQDRIKSQKPDEG